LAHFAQDLKFVKNGTLFRPVRAGSAASGVLESTVVAGSEGSWLDVEGGPDLQ
jgi:hypothetical protein